MTTDTLDLSFLSDESGPVTGDEDLARLILRAQEHHQHVRDQLQLVVSQSNTDTKLGEGDDAIVFEKGTDKCKGFRVGVQIALQLIGEFPIVITERGVSCDLPGRHHHHQLLWSLDAAPGGRSV